jgi:hypothetical protein
MQPERRPIVVGFYTARVRAVVTDYFGSGKTSAGTFHGNSMKGTRDLTNLHQGRATLILVAHSSVNAAFHQASILLPCY